MSAKTIKPGDPCTCKPGRYVRFVVPRGVPGLAAIISCRPNDSVRSDEIREHALPDGVDVLIHVPDLGTRRDATR